MQKSQKFLHINFKTLKYSNRVVNFANQYFYMKIFYTRFFKQKLSLFPYICADFIKQMVALSNIQNIFIYKMDGTITNNRTVPILILPVTYLVHKD